MSARRPLALRAAALGLVATAAGLGAGAASPSAAEDQPGPAAQAFEVDDAQLRWGINNESNNRAFAPGTFNYPSAGKVPDPGTGGRTIGADNRWTNPRTNAGVRAWRARAGDVRIEKATVASPSSADDFALATFGGLGKDYAGNVDGSATNDAFTAHQVVIDGGTGTVDPDSGDARIAWRGSFTVVYYSGMSFFYVSDPVLVVDDGRARLRATLSGFGSDMDDMSKWTAIPATEVVLADLGRIEVPRRGGVQASPRYLKQTVRVPSGAPDQRRDSAEWGSFPQTFVDFQGKVGSAAYWYSSGGSSDRFKVPSAMTLSYDAGAPVAPPDDDSGESDDDAGTPTAPSAPAPPSSGEITDDGATTSTPTDTAPRQRRRAPAVIDPRMPVVPVAYATRPTASPADPTDPDHHWEWWLGSLLLLGAAALLPVTICLSKGPR